MEQNQTLTNEQLQQAKDELEAVLKKYNISLVPVVVHQGERTFSSIEIIPRPQVQGIQPANQVVPDQAAPETSSAE